MGGSLIGYAGADWSRRRIAAVMGDAAARCAWLADLLGAVEMGDDAEMLLMQHRSVAAMRWAEGVFRAWARSEAAVLQQLGPDDLMHARAILDAAERAMP